MLGHIRKFNAINTPLRSRRKMRYRMKDLVKISALSGLLLSTTVLAGPFNIDAGDNNGPAVQIGSGQTIESVGQCTTAGGTVTTIPGASFCSGYSLSQKAINVSNLGFQINEATSVYYDVQAPGATSNVGVGDFFTDTGRGEYITLEGGPDLSENGYGDKDTWALTFDYSLYGFVIENGGQLAGAITGGFINIFYNDLTASDGLKQGLGDDTTQVLSVAISGSNGPLSTSIGLNLDGMIDYSPAANGGVDVGNSFVTDFFNFAKPQSVGGVSSTNFYELWVAGMSVLPNEFIDTLAVTTLNGLADSALDDVSNISYGASSNINIDTNEYTAVQNGILEESISSVYGVSAATLLGGNYATGQRTGENLSGNLSFAVVPAPSSLALFALSIFGLVAFGRKKK